MQSKVSIKDLLYITIQNMSKRRSRILLSIGNIFLGTSLVSSMMIISSLQVVKLTSDKLFMNLSEYHLWVSAISIIVCVITIFNSMLISVAERYKEIGIMKCLGAKSSLIVNLFLLEALLIGVIGGFLGFITSVIFTFPFSVQIGYILPLTNYAFIMFVSLLISIAITIFATMYPAFYASKINPVDALRYEV
ncbi:MAG: FtsX-like permease family protein [Candidatus Methanomethylicia archaeon]|nr:FtsX-like permease family protein [Candidatus Methanomethylicia archaeon]MDW7988860.1 FtsX-like permease family protein [Nitrososphaerota archaeon]